MGFVLATKTDGTLWSWGYSDTGQTGINIGGADKERSSPVQIPGTTWSSVPHAVQKSSRGMKS